MLEGFAIRLASSVGSATLRERPRGTDRVRRSSRALGLGDYQAIPAVAPGAEPDRLARRRARAVAWRDGYPDAGSAADRHAAAARRDPRRVPRRARRASSSITRTRSSGSRRPGATRPGSPTRRSCSRSTTCTVTLGRVGALPPLPLATCAARARAGPRHRARRAPRSRARRAPRAVASSTRTRTRSTASSPPSCTRPTGSATAPSLGHAQVRRADERGRRRQRRKSGGSRITATTRPAVLSQGWDLHEIERQPRELAAPRDAARRRARGRAHLGDRPGRAPPRRARRELAHLPERRRDARHVRAA